MENFFGGNRHSFDLLGTADKSALFARHAFFPSTHKKRVKVAKFEKNKKVLRVSLEFEKCYQRTLLTMTVFY